MSCLLPENTNWCAILRKAINEPSVQYSWNEKTSQPECHLKTRSHSGPKIKSLIDGYNACNCDMILKKIKLICYICDFRF